MIREFEAEPNVRLDACLAHKLEGSTRSFVKKLIEAGRVKVSGLERPADYRLKAGERIAVDWPAPAKGLEPGVIFEDKSILLLDKPAGLIVHPVGEAWLRAPDSALAEPETSVVAWILKNRPPVPGLERCGLVHRLDRGTSGVMAVAKDPQCQRDLLDQFREREVEKVYLAVVSGKLPKRSGTIEAPVGRVGKKLTATPYGREATTAYKVVKQGKATCLLEVRPMTGRTHQIRIHLAALGYPVLGDPEHGGPPASRLMLHAHRLRLTHKGKPLEGVSKPPKELLAAVG